MSHTTTKKIVITVTGDFTFPPVTSPDLSGNQVALNLSNVFVTKAHVKLGDANIDNCEFNLVAENAVIQYT